MNRFDCIFIFLHGCVNDIYTMFYVLQICAQQFNFCSKFGDDNTIGFISYLSAANLNFCTVNLYPHED